MSSSMPFPPGDSEGINAGVLKGSMLQQTNSAAFAHNALPVTITASMPPPAPPGAEVGCRCADAELVEATCACVDGAVAQDFTY